MNRLSLGNRNNSEHTPAEHAPAEHAPAEHTPVPRRSRSHGFTLIELIAVIVVLSIASTLGAGFVVDMVDQYQKAKVRSSLVQKGSVAIEQITRKLRMAVPNSLRVSGSGACVEYMPLLGGAFYTSAVADSENGRLPSNTIPTMSFDLRGATPRHVLVAPLASSEIYTSSGTSSRAAAGDFGASPYSEAKLSSTHRFIRNSINQRLLVADHPERFCLTGGQLVRYEDYGLLTSALGDGSPGGTTLIMSDNVFIEGAPFVLSLGSQDRNMALDITLRLTESGESVVLTGRVLVRNVP